MMMDSESDSKAKLSDTRWRRAAASSAVTNVFGRIAIAIGTPSKLRKVTFAPCSTGSSFGPTNTIGECRIASAPRTFALV